jgi:hypothetical protein
MLLYPIINSAVSTTDTMQNAFPSLFLSLYLCAGFDRPLNAYKNRVTAITEATGNCTHEASLLLQTSNTTSTVHELFIYSQAKCYNFLCKHGVIWSFNVIKV